MGSPALALDILPELAKATTWHDEDVLWNELQRGTDDPIPLDAILEKALDLKRLSLQETASLIAIEDPKDLEKMFAAAKKVKERVYGKRIVLFAPLYFSSYCVNNCTYCGYKTANKALVRRRLSPAEMAEEAQVLIDMGHKRTLMIAGEDSSDKGLKLLYDGMDAVYGVGKGTRASIRRININLAPLPEDPYKELLKHGMGTCQVFQETYHRETYERVHLSGPKSVMDWRLDVFDRAIRAGVGDVGMGFLLGLFDWRFEVLALLQHVEHLEKTFGFGPHTISIPRMEPVDGVDLTSSQRHPVSDDDFKKIVAIFRLAVPYTGMIMSTRENPAMRNATLELGISQISAASRVDPGGYQATRDKATNASQFSLGDHRPMDQVVLELMQGGFIPSNCTACEERDRMGKTFIQNHAMTGTIKSCCTPNAIQTLEEYLQDYASPETKAFGKKFVDEQLAAAPENIRAPLEKRVEAIRNGARFNPF